MGTILYQMLNKITPFTATTKTEFEEKIDAGDYTFTKHGLETITVECVTFICSCL